MRGRREALPRRAFLRSCAAGVAALKGLGTMTTQRHVVVVGSGAFGGWTALQLLRRGARVTLLDAWGPGNARASSGGETRVIRATYGPRAIYTALVARALQLWREHERRWNHKLYHHTGVLWMVSADDAYERAALPVLREAGLGVDELSPVELTKRYPQIDFAGVRWAIYERDAGYLAARIACAEVLKGFVAEGGEYRELAATPGGIVGEALSDLALSDGTRLRADAYVFACGAWLGGLLPEVLGRLIRPTRQEVFFFGTPPGDARYGDGALPVWIDHGERFIYGIPGNQWRGFKIADDTRGPAFDPTSGERVPTAQGVEAVRQYLAHRFPGLKGAPLLEARVCPYENSPDENFIVDRHPDADNVWLVGGGSGHGFKVGPALGELVADVVLGRRAPEPFFALSRFPGRRE